MPDSSDGILDGVVVIPTPDPSTGDDDVADIAQPSEIYEQNRARLLSAGASAHEHFVQFGKILDLAYESDRKMVSLVESLGVREVTSQSGQLGIPNAAQAGKV